MQIGMLLKKLHLIFLQKEYAQVHMRNYWLTGDTKIFRRRLTQDFPKDEFVENSEIHFTESPLLAVLHGVELGTTRISDGSKYRIPTSKSLPLYLDTLTQTPLHIGTINISGVVLYKYKDATEEIAHVNGQNSLEQWRADITSYKPQINAEWRLSTFLIDGISLTAAAASLCSDLWTARVREEFLNSWNVKRDRLEILQDVYLPERLL
jgi:hypothetical protein